MIIPDYAVDFLTLIFGSQFLFFYLRVPPKVADRNIILPNGTKVEDNEVSKILTYVFIERFSRINDPPSI